MSRWDDWNAIEAAQRAADRGNVVPFPTPKPARPAVAVPEPSTALVVAPAEPRPPVDPEIAEKANKVRLIAQIVDKLLTMRGRDE